jgi:ketosteroid isomerase-like protein
MYGMIVRRQSTETFARLSRGEWKRVTNSLADDVRHVFPGDSPLGGERRSRAEVIRWFERLDRLFPGHTFAVHRVVSRGWPWNTWVAVQWSVEMQPAAGEPYENHGSHWIQIRWGRVVAFHAYLDTQRIDEACRAMARKGVPEAVADPIGQPAGGS